MTENLNRFYRNETHFCSDYSTSGISCYRSARLFFSTLEPYAEFLYECFSNDYITITTCGFNIVKPGKRMYWINEERRKY